MRDYKQVEEQEYFIAKNGKVFKREHERNAYDMYYTQDMKELLSEYFSMSENARKKVLKGELPYGEYIVVKRELPQTLITYLNITMGYDVLPTFYYTRDFITSPILYYCEEYQRTFCPNIEYWVDLGDVAFCKSRIEEYKERLKKVEELMDN